MIRKQSVFLLSVLLMTMIFLQACSMLAKPLLLTAVNEGKVDEVERLLARGADPNESNKEGLTPLIVASAYGDDRMVEDLIAKKANVNAATVASFPYRNEIVAKGSTALMAALENFHTDIADKLISNGADVNAANENGSTALMIAAGKKDPEMVETLIDKGANVNAASTLPFQYKGETIFPGSTSLMAALYYNRTENVHILLDHGADVNAKTSIGANCLMAAASMCNAAMIKTLLEKGADPAAAVTKEFTYKGLPVFVGANPLMAAADAGKAENVAALISGGADPNATTKNGSTALMAAVAKGHLAAVKVLVENGADVNARITESFKMGKDPVPKGSSVISAAAYGGNADVVQYLIKKGADVNARDDEWLVDPLFLAATKGHFDAAKILIDNGADVFWVTKLGTARNTAAHNGYPYIVDLIDKARAKVKNNGE